MSDGYTEGMLLSEFLSGQSPMGDTSTRKDEEHLGKTLLLPEAERIRISPAKFFERYNIPRIERGKLLGVA